jgi:uncharacterized membrane protein
MTMESGGAAAPGSRRLYVGLIASLALNVLFIGGVAAAMWHHRHGPGGGRHGGESSMMGFARELSGDRQKLVRDDIAAARQTVRPLRKSVSDAWFEANTVLTQEPFDKDKYKAAMDRVTEAEGRFKMAVSAALADTAAKLTADERRALQQWREKRRPRMFGRHGYRDDKGGEGPEGHD